MKYIYWVLLICFPLLTILSCEKNPSLNETLVFYKKMGKSEQVFRKEIGNYETDSTINIKYEQSISPNDKFVLNYVLPNEQVKKVSFEKDGKRIAVYLMDSKLINIGKESYDVKRYKYDELNSIDDEKEIFFAKELGIVKEEFSFGNQLVLLSSSKISSFDIYVLQLKINEIFL